MIYLDHHTASPLRPGVLALMQDVALRGGNAASLHALGRHARRVLERAMAQVRHLCGSADAEVVFCGSAAEAHTLAVQGLAAARGREGRCGVALDAGAWHAAPSLRAQLQQHGCVLGRLERLEAAWGVRPWQPGGASWSAGVLALEAADLALAVVGVADAGAGARAPCPTLLAAARRAQVPLVVDAVAAAGRCPLAFDAWGAAALVLASAPLGGPPGMAAVVLRRDVDLVPLWSGGGQQLGRRSGTQAVAAAAGLGEAAGQAAADMGQAPQRLTAWAAALCAAPLRHVLWPDPLCGVMVAPMPAHRIAAAIAALAAHGAWVGWGRGTGAAAAGCPTWPEAIDAHVRLSLGWSTTQADVEAARRALTHWLDDPKTSACASL